MNLEEIMQQELNEFLNTKSEGVGVGCGCDWYDFSDSPMLSSESGSSTDKTTSNIGGNSLTELSDEGFTLPMGPTKRNTDLKVSCSVKRGVKLFGNTILQEQTVYADKPPLAESTPGRMSAHKRVMQKGSEKMIRMSPMEPYFKFTKLQSSVNDSYCISLSENESVFGLDKSGCPSYHPSTAQLRTNYDVNMQIVEEDSEDEKNPKIQDELVERAVSTQESEKSKTPINEVEKDLLNSADKEQVTMPKQVRKQISETSVDQIVSQTPKITGKKTIDLSLNAMTPQRHGHQKGRFSIAVKSNQMQNMFNTNKEWFQSGFRPSTITDKRKFLGGSWNMAMDYKFQKNFVSQSPSNIEPKTLNLDLVEV